MNKNYKVIYCKSTQTWVAVSELAKSGGKGKRAAVAAQNPYPLARLTLALLMSLGGIGQQAMAVTCVQSAGTATSAKNNSLACGNQATTGTTAGSTAIGFKAQASTKNKSTALGAVTLASEFRSTAVGAGTKATDRQSTAVGDRSQANGFQSVALGSLATAEANQSMAIGNNTRAINLASISIGGDDTDSKQAVGKTVGGKWVLTKAYPTSFKDAGGNDVYYGDVGAGVGKNVTATAGAKYDARWREALSGGLGAAAIGVHAQTLAEGAVAIGIGATAGKYTGPNADTPSQLTAADFTAANTSGQRATAIGAIATATGDQSTAIGVLARSIGDDSSAFGSNTQSIGERSSAMGYNSVTYTEGSIAIGENAVSGGYNIVAGKKKVADNTRKDAIAIGTGAQATGNQSIAIGTGNQVAAASSGAFGDPNIINGKNIANVAISGSYAIGNDNFINTSNTFVLGNDNVTNATGTKTSVANSVYLGNKTAVTAGSGVGTANLKQDGTAGTTTTAGDTGTVASATVGGVTYGGFAGATADGAVSVGAAGAERRIQNVAAGEISATSTDAINGSQLYSVAKTLGDAIGNVRNVANAGTASAMAMASLPQPHDPGANMVSAAIGAYEDQSALSIGLSSISDNGKWVIKGQVTYDTQSNFGAGLGAGYQW